MRRLRSVSSVVFAGLLACLPAQAHNYRMGVLDIEQLTGNTYRVVHQFSGMNDGPQLQRPPECEQISMERRSPLTQGVRTRTTWECNRSLESLPLDLEPRPAADIPYYFNWRSPRGEIISQPVGHWPLTVDEIRHLDTQASAPRYLRMGILHILSGWDHLAFVIGLLALIGRHARRLVGVITAFTLGHSLTLTLSVLDLVRVSTAYVECMIALSIVFLIAESLRARPDSLIRRNPAAIAIFFGLFHGLGFASALLEVGLPAAGRGWSIFQFNVGVEMGQLAFIGSVLLLGFITGHLRVSRADRGRMRNLFLQGIGVVAGYWTVERFATLV